MSQPKAAETMDQWRYLHDAEYHAKVYTVASQRCRHTFWPCADCLNAALGIVSAMPFDAESAS